MVLAWRRDLDAFANLEMANERASARDSSELDVTSACQDLYTEVRELIIEPEWFLLYRISETMNRLIAPALATVCGIATGTYFHNVYVSYRSRSCFTDNYCSSRSVPTRAAEASSRKRRKECTTIPATTWRRHVRPCLPFLWETPANGPSSPPTKTDHEIPDINNDKSIGAEVKQHLQDAKEEAVSTIQHAQQTAKTEVAPKKAWWGLGMFGASQGGEESPRENSKTN